MKESSQRIIQFLFGPLLAVIGFFMRHYSANRLRLNNLLKREKIKSFFQGLAIIILIIWVVVFYFAPEEKRGELTEQIKKQFNFPDSSRQE